MHPAKTFLLAAGCCLALLSACQPTVLPATTPPVEPPSPPTAEETFTEENSFPLATEADTTVPMPTETEPTVIAPPSSETESATTAPPPTETEPATTMPLPSETESATTAPPPTETESATTAPSPPESEPTSTTSPPPETEPTTTTSPPTQTEPIATEPPTEPATASPPPVLNRDRSEEAFRVQNQLLSQHDVAPLLWSESLYQVAARRTEEIADDYSHNGCPDWVAENILMGTDRADLAIQIWYDSPGHQRNMLAGWTYGAVANYGYYWVAVYAMTETP